MRCDATQIRRAQILGRWFRSVDTDIRRAIGHKNKELWQKTGMYKYMIKHKENLEGMVVRKNESKEGMNLDQ